MENNNGNNCNNNGNNYFLLVDKKLQSCHETHICLWLANYESNGVTIFLRITICNCS